MTMDQDNDRPDAALPARGNGPVYVIMDLEMNYPNNRFRSERNGIRLPSEIIEIGAVRLGADLEITDRYRRYVRPSVYSKMNTKVKELTEITEDDLAGAAGFPEAIEDFLEWCGRDAVFVTWSENDIISLENNMIYHGLDPDRLPVCYDLQIVFDDQVTMEDRDYSLSYAMWKLDIRPEYSHDALNDAINTAAVMKKLDLSGGLDGYEV